MAGLAMRDTILVAGVVLPPTSTFLHTCSSEYPAEWQVGLVMQEFKIWWLEGVGIDPLKQFFF